MKQFQLDGNKLVKQVIVLFSFIVFLVEQWTWYRAILCSVGARGGERRVHGETADARRWLDYLATQQAG